MQEKTKLINSMSNLINHVSLSRANQEEIFNTLSNHDFKKMLSNLQDINEKLRRVTFLLLAELLYQNNDLKERFCNIMNVHPAPGKVVLSNSFPKNIFNLPQDTIDLLKLLKQPVPPSENNAYVWYLNLKQKPRKIQYLPKTLINIDPIDYIVGFVIPNLQPQNFHNPVINNFFKPKIVLSEQKGAKKLNQSYQQQIQTERQQNQYKNDSFYAKKSNNRSSFDEDKVKQKYYPITDSKQRESSNTKIINSYAYSKTPMNSSYKTEPKSTDLDQSIRQQKYIKSPLVNVQNPTTISVTHRPGTGNGNIMLIRGIETTRDKPNGYSFIKSAYQKH